VKKGAHNYKGGETDKDGENRNGSGLPCGQGDRATGKGGGTALISIAKKGMSPNGKKKQGPHEGKKGDLTEVGKAGTTETRGSVEFFSKKSLLRGGGKRGGRQGKKNPG